VGSRVLDAAKRSAVAHGLDIAGVLPKPFSAATLRNLLNQALERFPGVAQAHAGGRRTPRRKLSVQDLREALDNHQITLAYQPKVHCLTGTLVGFEALARWHHPVLGHIGPDVFIPLAEEHGLISRLTSQISDLALSWLAELSSAETARRTNRHTLQQALLSLNISATSLSDQQLFEDIIRRCEQLSIAPQRVVLELTESSAMQDATTALDNMTRLRLQGFHLSIDDFGTGYSSMVQLVKLPFSEIKVDKAFVMTALHSEESRAIVRSVVDLGRGLRLHTTAEGVENEATLDFLRELGCEYAQGYGISPPLAPDAVIPWYLERETLREEQRLTAAQGTGLLDTPPESRFDRVTRLTRRLFTVQASIITLLDRDRHWFKSREGLDMAEVSRQFAFCDTAIDADGVFVVQDAKADPRFRDNPLVTGPPFVRFYAGHHLCLTDGQKVGTLCLIDAAPRAFSAQDEKQLIELARMAERELAHRDEEQLDEQTGLLNREAYLQQALSTIAFCRQTGLAASVICVRLMDLAIVNQRFGTLVGDELIRNLGELTRHAANGADLVGRRRGTETAVMLIDPGEEVVLALCQRLQAAIEDWNARQAPGGARLYCEIATARIMPSATGTLDQIIRNTWTPFAFILDS
ncbi:MAG: EAL domain-containing protein, partial [Aquisalimonadaceae bacterium]